MKNLLFLFFISFAANAYGQNDFLGNTAQGGNITFNCSQKSGNTVIVYNQQTGLISHDTTSNKGNNCSFALITQEGYNRIYNVARQVFSQARANELASNKSIRFFISITPQGQVIGITYRLYNNTQVTTAELAALDTALMQSNLPLRNSIYCNHLSHMVHQGQIHFNKLYQ